jgi:hypothetical protein
MVFWEYRFLRNAHNSSVTFLNEATQPGNLIVAHHEGLLPHSAGIEGIKAKLGG